MNDPAPFWSWFLSAEKSYRDLEVSEKETLLDELQRYLHEFSDQLWFEVGGAPQGPHELIISAEGRLDAFPDVRRLVAAAPEIPGWRIIAFKQPQGFDFTTHYKDLTLSPEATWFLPLVKRNDPDALGVRLAFAHYDPERRGQFIAASYVMLEAGLGELVTADRIHYVDVVRAPDSPTAEGYIELKKLPDYLATRRQE